VNKGLASSKRFILVLGLLTGMVAFAIDVSLPAIPPMVRDLGTTMSNGQQIVGLFMAGLAIGQLPSGLISDRIGRMPVLYFGMVLTTLAGIVTSLSNDITIILVARFVQGIGASAGTVLARAIVRDISSGQQAARLMSLMVMIFTAAPMIAPLLGAYLVIAWDWHAPFIAVTVAALLILIGIRTSLQETHQPSNKSSMRQQLGMSLHAFRSEPQCLFGLMIALTTIAGIMTLVSGSASLVVDLYRYPVQSFGYIFALTGVSILFGSTVNRRLLQRFSPLQMIGVGAALAGTAGVQLLIMAWIGDVSFWWIWSNACLFMCGTAFLLPNATAFALEPVPEIAGVAASLIGTAQSVVGALSAIIGSLLYTGSILNVTLVVGLSGIAVALVYLSRNRILGSPTKASE